MASEHPLRLDDSTALVLTGLSKRFPNGVEAVSDVTLEVRAGELLALVGPSGSGKSTLLRLIAGLETADAGTIRLRGRDVSRRSPRERDVSLAFQTPALYPYLSVFNNLAFGLRARGASGSEIREEVGRVAAALGLDGVLSRRPHSLSGGQRQRVALGRAVARRPGILLLDEPLSSLDGPLRAAVRDLLVEIHRSRGLTTVLVTHDQGEALAIGDRLGVMDRGRLVQIGTPYEVYDVPGTRVVGEFLGNPPMNVVRCRVLRDGRLVPEGLDDEATLSPPATAIVPPSAGPGLIDLGVRPEHLRIVARDEPAEFPGSFPVRRIEFFGNGSVVTVEVGGKAVRVRVPSEARVRPGDEVRIGFDPRHASWFDATTGEALGARANPTALLP